MKYAIYALMLSALVTIALGPVVIPMLRRLKFGQNERSDGPQSHLSKAGTPTMGGMMFIAGILAGTLAFSLTQRSFRFRRFWRWRRLRWWASLTISLR